MKVTASKYIVKRKSDIHGYGIFAKMDIPNGTRIIEYVGEKITKAEAQRRGPLLVEYAKQHHEHGAVYLFILNKKYDIDGHVHYNTAKYVNHSCDPNCEVDVIRGRIWVIAKRDIRKGKELSYNYSYEVEEFEDHPCRCASTRCAGYIVDEELWPRLKKILRSRKIKSQ